MSQPTVISTTPNSDTTNVAIDISPVITFDQALDSNTVDETTGTIYRASKVTIKPLATLPKNTVLGVMVRGGTRGIKNGAGEYLASSYHFQFTTGESFATPGPTTPEVPTYPSIPGATPTLTSSTLTSGTTIDTSIPGYIPEASPDASGTIWEGPLTPDEFYIISVYPEPQTSNIEPSGLIIKALFNSVPDLASASGNISVYAEPVNGDVSIFRPRYESGTISVLGKAIQWESGE
jgi:hypothetical protein